MVQRRESALVVQITVYPMLPRARGGNETNDLQAQFLAGLHRLPYSSKFGCCHDMLYLVTPFLRTSQERKEVLNFLDCIMARVWRLAEE